MPNKMNDKKRPSLPTPKSSIWTNSSKSPLPSFSGNEDPFMNRIPGWIGDHLIRLEKTKKALMYYNDAIKRNPLDAQLLYRRAKVNEQCFKLDKAITDIEKSMRLNPQDLNTICRRMGLTLLSGDFENSLLVAHNNIKYRKQPSVFLLGGLLAKSAINNCVGTNAGHPLRDHYEIIRELAWMKNMSMQKGHPKRRWRHKKRKTVSIRKSRILIESVKPPKPTKPFNIDVEEDEDEIVGEIDSMVSALKKKAGFRSTRPDFEEAPSKLRKKQSLLKSPSSTESRAESLQSLTNQSLRSSLGDSLQDRDIAMIIPKLRVYTYKPLQKRTSNIMNYMAAHYLGELFPEKQFLIALPKRQGCTGKNDIGNQLILETSKDGVHILEKTQEILRVRKPFYYIKYQQLLTRSKKNEMDKMNLLERKQDCAMKKLNQLFAKIARWVKKMDIRRMSRTAEYMYKYCKTTDRTILPDKEFILHRLYKLVGDGYLFSNRFVPGMSHQLMITRVLLALGLPAERTISQESLFRKIKGRSLNWQDLIQTYEQRVRICKYSEELIWLYHELSRFNIEMKRYNLAKTYANRCIYEARKCESFKWAVNGYLMLTKVSVLQKNGNDVRRNLRITIGTAKTIQDEELDFFLQTCWEVINEWKFEDDKVDHLLKQRQEQIIGLMVSYEQKREASLLFERIRQKPIDRRLPIVPGLVDLDEYDMIERRKEERRNRVTHSSATKRGIEAERLIAGYIFPTDGSLLG